MTHSAQNSPVVCASLWRSDCHPAAQVAGSRPPLDSATTRRMTLLLAWPPPRQTAPAPPPSTEGNWGTLHCHPAAQVAGSRPPLDSATSRRMTLLLAWQPPVRLRLPPPSTEGNWGTLHCHPARSRRVQASSGFCDYAQNDAFTGVAATPSDCACPPLRRRGIGAHCTVTLREVAGSRPPLDLFRGSLVKICFFFRHQCCSTRGSGPFFLRRRC